MDRIQAPIYPRPMVPLGARETGHSTPNRVKGKVVGVRSGRSGEVGHTQILTIKIVSPAPETHRLLHADVEIVLPVK